MTDAEKWYTVTKQECLAMIWSIRKFRCYLENYAFTVITDHSSLRWLNNLRNPTGRLARWALELTQYDYTVLHRKGAFYHVPDALSRIPEALTDEKNLRMMTETEEEWYKKKFRLVERSPDHLPDWKIENGHLYHHRPLAFISAEIPDLDA